MAPTLALVAGLFCGAWAKDGWEEKVKDGRVVQEMKIEAPMMTEEDQYGYTMPTQYKCDSCKAVMFHLNKAVKDRHPKSRRMKDWEYQELFEETCKGAFEGYGIKLVHGKNKLSGPGLPVEEQLTPGSGAIQMGGEGWTKRLGEICRRIVFDQVGEDDFYEIYRESGGFESSICYDVTKDCVPEKIGPEEPPKPEKPKAKKEKRKDKPSKAEKAKSEKDKQLEKFKTAERAHEEQMSKARAERAEKANKGKEKALMQKAGNAVAKEAASLASKQGAVADDQPMDHRLFFGHLATVHGFHSDEYLDSRSAKEWEKHILAMAGRILKQRAEKPEDESCSA